MKNHFFLILLFWLVFLSLLVFFHPRLKKNKKINKKKRFIFGPTTINQEIVEKLFIKLTITYIQHKRGVQMNITYIDDTRIMMKYKLPLNEVVVDFFDKLKSISSGYARFVPLSVFHRITLFWFSSVVYLWSWFLWFLIHRITWNFRISTAHAFKYKTKGLEKKNRRQNKMTCTCTWKTLSCIQTIKEWIKLKRT